MASKSGPVQMVQSAPRTKFTVGLTYVTLDGMSAVAAARCCRSSPPLG